MQLRDYVPKADIRPFSPGRRYGQVIVPTRIDVDDAVRHYNNMTELLGSRSPSPNVVTCNLYVETRNTVKPMDLGELRGVLEREPKEEIRILYNAIMREIRGGGGGQGGGGGEGWHRSWGQWGQQWQHPHDHRQGDQHIRGLMGDNEHPWSR